jgi:hypothetical protein
VRTRFVVGLTGLALLGALAPATAGAVVQPELGVSGVGLQPRVVSHYAEGVNVWKGEKEEGELNEQVFSLANPADHPVLHSAGVYAIYWDPAAIYHGDWQELIDRFLQHVSESNGELSSVFAVDAQYYGSNGSSSQPATSRARYEGSFTDTNPYPESGCVDPGNNLLFGLEALGVSPCFTDSQVRTQLATFIAQHHLPTGMGTVYDILTPPGVTLCLEGASEHCSQYKGNGESIETLEKEGKTAEPEYQGYAKSFCSYHSAINTGGPEGNSSTIVYAAIPWVAGEEGYMGGIQAALSASFPCQDGGFQPSQKAENSGLQEKETATEPRGLSGPHIEEPNQLGTSVGPDGTHDHGLADVIINQIAVEQQNMVTDPLLNAWQQQEGPRNEVTDECRNSFFPVINTNATAIPQTRAGSLSNQLLHAGEYYLNDAFNLTAYELAYPGIPCLPGASLVPEFSIPAAVNTGEIVGFNGMESDVTLGWASLGLTAHGQGHLARFTWNFGDGSPVVSGVAPGGPTVNSPEASPCEAPWQSPCAGSAFHTYTYGGNYNVTLTITDIAGNTATVMHPVTVIGPAAPPAAGSGSGAVGGPAGHSGPSFAAPIARAAALSASLRAAVRHGIMVSYSVNEQVAGVVEALLPASTAHRLRIHAPAAAGLPSGLGRMVVIGRAVLVTRKGGHGVLRLRFTKGVARALSRQRRVTVTLRMEVRNAETSHPKTASLISTVVLSGGSGHSGPAS